MAEEVEIEWVRGQATHGLQFLAQGGGCEHGAGNRAETAGLAHGGSQSVTLRAGHWRLDQGEFAAEQSLQRHRGFSLSIEEQAA
jgi:hypothetical protein